MPQHCFVIKNVECNGVQTSLIRGMKKRFDAQNIRYWANLEQCKSFHPIALICAAAPDLDPIAMRQSKSSTKRPNLAIRTLTQRSLRSSAKAIVYDVRAENFAIKQSELSRTFVPQQKGISPIKV